MEEKTFEFKDIFVEVLNEDKKQNTKYVRLLDGISGTFMSGRLTAVMGASGAGKSTLFDVLLGRIDNSSKTYGSITYKGKERTDKQWIHQVSYLKQFDTFFPKFSLMESILYNLDFYQPGKSEKEKLRFAEEILRMANIYRKRYANVESLSGGECKRAMIALSLCGDPEIIFMDEPTSGLDSHTALTMINFIKEFAEKNNKIVVISLHQPGRALLNLFEDILYLSKGAVFYNGKLKKISEWLKENGIVKPERISLAEYLFELHSDNPFKPEIAETKPIVNQIIETNREKYNELRKQVELKKGISNYLIETSFSFTDMFTLWRRFYLNILRTSNLFLALFFRLSFISFSCFLMIVPYYLILDVFAKTHSRTSDTLSESVYVAKKLFSKNGYSLFTLKSFNLSCTQLMDYLVLYFIYDFFADKKFYLEDIYSGKFSILTCYIANVAHDCLSSISLFIIIPIILYITPISGLLGYSFLLYVILYAICYSISLIFLKHLLGGSSKLSTGMFTLLLFMSSSFFSSTFLFDFVAGLNNTLLWWFEYLSYIYIFFPYVIILHIYKYEEYKLMTNILQKNEIYLDIGKIQVKNLKSQVFDFLRLNELPSLWACYILLSVSIVLNILVSFYLFNRQIKASIRLKLN